MVGLLTQSKGHQISVHNPAYKTIAKTQFRELLNVLTMKAHRGKRYPVYIRSAAYEPQQTIYIDLCNDNWDCIAITSYGWDKTTDVPVKFIRSAQMKALPEPARQRNNTLLAYLSALLNVGTTDERILIAGYLIYSLRGKGPYPLLCVVGEAGSCKSTTCEMLKNLIDPAEPLTRSLPFKDEEQFMVGAMNNHVLVFDNISHIAAWQADALCRLATGAGLGVRQHYKHKEEIVYVAQRPVVLNGIEDFMERSDLADRSIVIELPRVMADERRTIKEYWERVRKHHPRILGCLMDALVCALTKLSSVEIGQLPRMADFAVFVTAAESALGLREGEFLRAYQNNITRTTAVPLESCVVLPAIQLLVQVRDWEGTATDLLKRLEGIAGEERYSKEWPKAANALSGILARNGRNLEQVGIIVTAKRTNAGRWFSLKRQGLGVATARRVVTISDGRSDDVEARPSTAQVSVSKRDRLGDVTM